MLRGQFTYTASSGAGAWDQAAGWKVRSAIGVVGRPGVPEDVIRRAARNVGGFVPPALPELPSRADVEALPRCLRLDTLDEGLVCISQIVAAGPDYSGRPNFFAHGLLVELGEDEADDDGRFLRPADLWQADFWLHPLGVKEVETAEPDPGVDRLSRGWLDDEALEDFMRRRPNQRDVVLAAFERRLLGGGPLVVVGDDPGSVAQWLRLVGLLVLPSTAWRLSFSTYERVQDVETPTRWPFDVVGVPATDAPTAYRLRGEHFGVLRDGEAPPRSGADRWALPDRSELTAGPWARLAESVVVTGLLPAVVQQLDQLAIEVRSSTVDQPLWALPAAVLLLEDLPFDELGGDAADLALAHWPPRLSAGTRTVERLLGRLREHVAPTALADTVLRRAGGSADGDVARLLLVQQVRETFASREAYGRLADRLPAALPELPPAARADVDESLRRALAWVSGAGDVAPRALLHLAALTDASRDLAAATADRARTLLAPRLLAPEVNPSERGWPPMPGWLWERLRPALEAELEADGQLPGQGMSAATRAWLGPLAPVERTLPHPSPPSTEPVPEARQTAPSDRLVGDPRLAEGPRPARAVESQLEVWAARALIQDEKTLAPLLEAAHEHASSKAWDALGEALLRLDARKLPIHGLPTRLHAPSYPWGEAYQLLRRRWTEPEDRLVLAANLIVRGARAELFPRDDHAATWLATTGDPPRYRTAAKYILGDLDPGAQFLALVRDLTSSVVAPVCPFPGQRDDWHRRDLSWREEALTAARTVSRGLTSTEGGTPGRNRGA